MTSFSSFVVVAVFFTGRKSSAACQRLGLTPPDLRTFVRPDNCQQRYRRHHTLAGGRSRTSPQNTAVGTRVMGVLTPLPLMRVSPDVIHLYPDPLPLRQLLDELTYTVTSPIRNLTESSPACSLRINSCSSTNHVTASISCRVLQEPLGTTVGFLKTC